MSLQKEGFVQTGLWKFLVEIKMMEKELLFFEKFVNKEEKSVNIFVSKDS